MYIPLGMIYCSAVLFEAIINLPTTCRRHIEYKKWLNSLPNYYIPPPDITTKQYKDVLYVIHNDKLSKAKLMRHKHTNELAYVLLVNETEEICYPVTNENKIQQT